MTLFAPWILRNATAPNRIVRSATYEGLADEEGRPRRALGRLYSRLASADVGTIITGFAYVSRAGRAMQPRQCGIDRDDRVEAWATVVDEVREVRPETLLLMQIAHAGRQTIASATGGAVLAPSAGRSPYFRSRPRVMSESDVSVAIGEFVAAAGRARQAGFDGVQIHGAHGYLVHQFLSPRLNRRWDRWGADRLAFLREVVVAIKDRCGDSFSVFVKLSGADDGAFGLTPTQVSAIAGELEAVGVEAVEVSYGTMDLAFNIFRGEAPVDRALEVNPLFCRRSRWQLALWRRIGWPRMRRRLLPFREAYNRLAAREIRKGSSIPVVLVGGIRTLACMHDIIDSGDADAVALCRPLICEPDLVTRLQSGRASGSSCTNCNLCAVHCDSAQPVRCHRTSLGEEGEEP